MLNLVPWSWDLFAAKFSLYPRPGNAGRCISESDLQVMYPLMALTILPTGPNRLLSGVLYGVPRRKDLNRVFIVPGVFTEVTGVCDDISAIFILHITSC